MAKAFFLGGSLWPFMLQILLLKETYGLVLYQEQFMQIVHAVAELSLGEANLIRRRMIQRKEDQVKMWHRQFREAAQG